VSITPARQSAIDEFYKKGAREAWAGKLRSLFLPWWGAESPNQLDWVTLTDGAFVGGVTHAATHFAGNGTSGYLNTGVQPAAVGLTPGNGWLGSITLTASSNEQYLGIINGATQQCTLRHTSMTVTTDYADGSSGRWVITVSDAAKRTGIISFHRRDGVRTVARRGLSDREVLGTESAAAAGPLPAFPMFYGARNNAGTADQFTTQQLAGCWLGVDVSDLQDSQFTAALQTLWSKCVSGVLPS